MTFNEWFTKQCGERPTAEKYDIPTRVDESKNCSEYDYLHSLVYYGEIAKQLLADQAAYDQKRTAALYAWYIPEKDKDKNTGITRGVRNRDHKYD
jgi:hypothetical protein